MTFVLNLQKLDASGDDLFGLSTHSDHCCSCVSLLACN